MINSIIDSNLSIKGANLILYLDPANNRSYSSSNVLYNISSNVSTCTFSGSPTTATTGNTGRTIVFPDSGTTAVNGIVGRISNLTLAKIGNGSYTLISFVKNATNTPRTGVDCDILSSNDIANKGDFLFMYAWTGTVAVLRTHIWNDAGTAMVADYTLPNTNTTWRMIATRFNGSTRLDSWINLAQTATVTCTGTYTNSTKTDFLVGNRVIANGANFRGEIGITMAYNSYLSDNELIKIFNKYRSRYGI